MNLIRITSNFFGNYKKISNETPKTFHSLNVQTSMNEFYGEFMFKGVSTITNDGNVKISEDEKIEYHQTPMKLKLWWIVSSYGNIINKFLFKLIAHWNSQSKNVSQMKILSKEFLQEVSKLESESYPSDEAASKENLLYRLENASNLFLGLFDENEKIIGYVCGTLSNEEKLTHESMFQHQNNGGKFLNSKLNFN